MAATPAAAAGVATLCSDMVDSIHKSVLENSGFLHDKHYKIPFVNPLQTASNACKQLGFGEMAPPYCRKDLNFTQFLLIIVMGSVNFLF